MSTYTMGFSKARGPEHRRDKRLVLPVFVVKIAGRECETVNWSLGGLLIGGYDGKLLVERLVEIEIKAKDSVAELHMSIKSKVIRVDRDKGEVALKFENLSPQMHDFFERCFSQKLHRANPKR